MGGPGKYFMTDATRLCNSHRTVRTLPHHRIHRKHTYIESIISQLLIAKTPRPAVLQSSESDLRGRTVVRSGSDSTIHKQ
jgi:hypothetical protein